MDKVYIVVRADLPLGDQLAQVGHAAFGLAFDARGRPDLDTWYGSANNLVVLEVPDEAALEHLRSRIFALDLPCFAMREPDLGDEQTAISFGGTPAAQRVVSSLPLAAKWRGAA
jgi:peptidyl-tRNA hydrolase